MTLVRLTLMCTSAGSYVAIFQPSLTPTLTLTDSCVAIHMIALAHAGWSGGACLRAGLAACGCARVGGGVRAALACMLNRCVLCGAGGLCPVTCDSDIYVASPQSFSPALAAYAVGADEKCFLRSIQFAPPKAVYKD